MHVLICNCFAMASSHLYQSIRNRYATASSDVQCEIHIIAPLSPGGSRRASYSIRTPSPGRASVCSISSISSVASVPGSPAVDPAVLCQSLSASLAPAGGARGLRPRSRSTGSEHRHAAELAVAMGPLVCPDSRLWSWQMFMCSECSMQGNSDECLFFLSHRSLQSASTDQFRRESLASVGLPSALETPSATPPAADTRRRARAVSAAQVST